MVKVMISVFLLNVLMLSVIILTVIMLSVFAFFPKGSTVKQRHSAQRFFTILLGVIMFIVNVLSVVAPLSFINFSRILNFKFDTI
jgi:hypothetical protein